MSKLDFLTDDDADDLSADTETQADETAETEGAPPPEAAEPVVEPAPTPEAEPQAPSQSTASQTPPGHVPLAALLDARDKAKEYERQIEQLRSQLPGPQQQVPDPYNEPEQFRAYQEAQTQNLILNTRLDLSEEMARSKYGDELVNEARDAILSRMAQSPAYAQEVLSHRNPYEFVVQEHRRHQALSKLGDPSELDAYLAWKAAQAVPATPATAAPAAPPTRAAPSVPPRSLAAAPSAGGLATEIIDEDEGTVFAKKG